jgi:predicted dehydrogenase
VHGTEGTLLYGTPESTLLIRTKAAEGQYTDWTELAPAENVVSAFNQWVSHIQNNTEDQANLDMAAELTRLMEAANRSAKEGRRIALTELQKA